MSNDHNTKKTVTTRTLNTIFPALHDIYRSMNKDAFEQVIQTVCDRLVHVPDLYDCWILLCENENISNVTWASLTNTSEPFEKMQEGVLPRCARQVLEYKSSMRFKCTQQVCCHCLYTECTPRICYVTPLLQDEEVIGLLSLSAHPDRFEDESETALIDDLAQDLVQLFIRQEKMKSAEQGRQKLIQQGQKYRLLVESAPDLIFIFDMNKKLTYYNKTFQKFTADEKLEPGTLVTDFMAQADIDSIIQCLSNFEQNSENRIAKEIVFINKTGDQYHLDCFALPLFHQNVLDAVLIDARDISLQKKLIQDKVELENKVTESQRLETIGTMAGGIAHDFNNILMPIIGYSDMALSTIADNDSMAEYFQQILKSANRARDLVSQVLSFSRKTDQELLPLNLKSFLTGLLKEFSLNLPENIHIHRHLDKSCPDVLANAEQIKVLVKNLCYNAFEAVEENGGSLTVSLKHVTISEEMRNLHPQLAASSYAELIFKDDGCGMDDNIREKIFEPFYTTDKLHRAKGLGLSVVHGIVMSHNGDIIVKSSPGSGTEFLIYLPVIQTDKEDSVKVEDVAGGKEMVMIVDDEEAVGHILQHMLHRLGYKVKYFNGGVEALHEFKKNGGQYDLILTDLSMPSMTGLELTMQIRLSNSHIPIILITGFCETLDKNLQQDYGVQAILGKPILARELDKEIRTVLQNLRVE